MALTTLKKQSLEINSDLDLLEARKFSRIFAKNMGFTIVNQTKIVTAVSELVRNVLLYAKSGIIHLHLVESKNKRGLMIIVRDNGPGITNLELALQDGYSTSGGLGKGLPGTKRLTDEFSIKSEVNKGTEVKVIKWVQ